MVAPVNPLLHGSSSDTTMGLSPIGELTATQGSYCCCHSRIRYVVLDAIELSPSVERRGFHLGDSVAMSRDLAEDGGQEDW